MKFRIIVALLSIVFLSLSISGCKKERIALPSPTFRVLINGIPMSLESSKPVFDDEIQYVPARVIMERLGYNCVESSVDKSLICTKDETSIILTANSREAIINQAEITYLLASPYYEKETMYIEAHFFENVPFCTVEWDVESESLQIYNYNELDYGLYFFDGESDTWGDWDAVGCQKFVLGEENPFYDPEKPTLIWIHGWQNGGVAARGRPSFLLDSDGINKYTHQVWKDKGWNVAIFHWLQFADELLPYNAESKINAATNNDVDMRWKKADGDYSNVLAEAIPVSELFARAYGELASVQTNNEIRLAGSSFGGQVALHGAERILNNNASLLPSRIALLDMAWTSNYVDNQELYTTEITSRAAATLSPLIPIEYYRSSALTTSFTPDELIDNSAFQEMTFDYAGVFGIELKHTIVTHHYLWSLEFGNVPAYDSDDNLVGQGLSATSSNNAVREKMGNNFHWQHMGGANTYTPEDDVFERQDGAGY